MVALLKGKMQILKNSLSKGLETIRSLPKSLKTIRSLPKSFKPGGEGSPVAGCNTQDLDWGSYVQNCCIFSDTTELDVFDKVKRQLRTSRN